MKRTLLVVLLSIVGGAISASPTRSSVAARQSSIFQLNEEFIPASEYVQDGLHAIFDAIENVASLTHDPAATVWVDLIGGLRMQMSAASWTESSYDCAESNSGHVYWNTMPEYPFYPSFMTIEIVLRNCKDNYRNMASLVFGGRQYQKMNIVRSTMPMIWGMSYQKNGFYFNNTGSISAVFNDTSDSSDRVIYVDGMISETTDAYKENFGISGIQGISINPRGDYPFNGEVCCIRLYTRRLDEDEILHNASIDKVRFSLP